MKIELGNFGFSRPEVVQPAEKSQVAQAVGAAGLRISAAEEEAQRNREAFQRAQAANDFAKYQLALEDAGRSVEEDMATGALSWDQANEEYGKRAQKIQAPQTKLDSPIDRENQQAAVAHAQERTRQSLAPSIFQARQRAGAAQLDSFLDTQAKRAVEPGANIDQINASADAFGANARQYGLPENLIAAKVQNFKDANWFNAALQRTVDADGDLPALKGILHDITDPKGIYAGKLDPTKRATLQASVQGQIDRIELRAQAHADRMEARAERTIGQIERQLSSGVAATPEMWADWGSTVKGTSVEPQFHELVESEKTIQKTLTAPIPDQLALVEKTQADLVQNGGSVAQVANADRLRRAVEGNIKLLTTQPLLFAEQRMGDKIESLDMGQAMAPGGAHTPAAAVLQERATRIRALSSQFKAPVPQIVLLPEERAQVADVVQKGSPQQVSQVFGALRESSGSPDVFRSIVQQIAPDAPVKAYAGLMAANRAELVTRAHWFKPDETVTSQDVAATLLEGDRILNKSSTAKKEDGKPDNKLVLPESKDLQSAFVATVGNSFAGRPQAAETAFQAVQAYYAGRVAQTGNLAADTKDVDRKLVQEAVKATQGVVADVNGSNVLAPWGMAEHDFDDRIMAAFNAKAKEAGLPESFTLKASGVGLTNTDAEGVYAVTVQRRLWPNAQSPMLISIRPPGGAGMARSYIQR